MQGYPLLILFSSFTTFDVIFPFKCIFDNRLLNNSHLHTVWSEICKRTKEKLFCRTSLAERRRCDVTSLTGDLTNHLSVRFLHYPIGTRSALFPEVVAIVFSDTFNEPQT